MTFRRSPQGSFAALRNFGFGLLLPTPTNAKPVLVGDPGFAHARNAPQAAALRPGSSQTLGSVCLIFSLQTAFRVAKQVDHATEKVSGMRLGASPGRNHPGKREVAVPSLRKGGTRAFSSCVAARPGHSRGRPDCLHAMQNGPWFRYAAHDCRDAILRVVFSIVL